MRLGKWERSRPYCRSRHIDFVFDGHEINAEILDYRKARPKKFRCVEIIWICYRFHGARHSVTIRLDDDFSWKKVFLALACDIRFQHSPAFRKMMRQMGARQ